MQFFRLFPTNVALTKIKDFDSINNELDSLPFLNDNSYHFTKRRDLWDLRTQHPAIQSLYDQMMGAIVDYANNYHANQTFDVSYFTATDGWTNETKNGENVYIHNHKLTHLTCVYYRAITKDAGAIEFIDPRGSLGFISLDKTTGFNIFRLQPEPGDLLIFPGWLLHYVHPNKTDTPRKIIGANVMLNEDSREPVLDLSSRKTGKSIMKLG